MSSNLPRSLVLAFLLAACGSPTAAEPPPAAGRTVAIEVGARGYTPAEVAATAGEPLRLVFTRTTDRGCGQQLVFPTLDIRKDLPLNEAVPVDITMPASGSVAFTCGMAMYKGHVVAE